MKSASTAKGNKITESNIFHPLFGTFSVLPIIIFYTEENAPTRNVGVRGKRILQQMLNSVIEAKSVALKFENIFIECLTRSQFIRPLRNIKRRGNPYVQKRKMIVRKEQHAKLVLISLPLILTGMKFIFKQKLTSFDIKLSSWEEWLDP